MTLLIVSAITLGLIATAYKMHLNKQAELDRKFEAKIKRIYDKTTDDWNIYILEEKIKEERKQ